MSLIISIGLVLFFVSINLNQINCCRLDFIAKYGNTNGETVSRSAASYGRTIRFTKKGQFLYWVFVTQSTCSIDILNVLYTNDGPSDNLTVYLDENFIGSFQTVEHSREGVYWNKIVESGLIGRTTVLQQGNHTLNISIVTVDIHGVEIDKVTIGVLCDDDLCSIKILGQSTNDNTIAPPDDGNLDKGHIISLAIGVSSTAISVLIAIPTLIVAFWSIYKCVKGDINHRIKPSAAKLRDSLLNNL